MMFTPFEPKVSFRFLMTIAGIPSYIIKAAQMPNLDNGQINIDFNNVDFKVKAKSRWQNIAITLYDPVDPSGAKAVHDWIKIHHNSQSGKDGFAFTEYKKDLTLQAMNPKISAVETWTLYGAYIKTSNWGQMDWSTDEAKTIELEIAYDYAVLG